MCKGCLGALSSFIMLGMSVPSLHGESTNSLIKWRTAVLGWLVHIRAVYRLELHTIGIVVASNNIIYH